MSNEQPFQPLFESFGRPGAAHAELVNRGAREQLSAVLAVPVEQVGRCVLLRAPRAGHGKTHLLSRIAQQSAGTHEFIAVQVVAGSRVDAASVMEDALRGLTRPLAAGGGLCQLDLVARRLFALALRPLVRSGEVPCLDREAALAALSLRPVETFDFPDPMAVTARWARENIGVLGPRMALVLAEASGNPPGEVGVWVDLLFRCASTALDDPGRIEALVMAATSVAGGEGQAVERLGALLGLVALLGRVVLVVDDLEVLSVDDGAALSLSVFLGALRQAVERLDVVISLNEDIWRSAFLPRLSDGMADRLSEVVIDLAPLDRSEMMALLDSRAPGEGGRVLESLDLAGAEAYARGVIRAAAEEWERAARGEPLVGVAAAVEPFGEKAAVPIEPTTPAASAAGDPAQAESAPSVPPGVDAERVDELLRQFRARYGDEGL